MVHIIFGVHVSCAVQGPAVVGSCYCVIIITGFKISVLSCFGGGGVIDISEGGMRGRIGENEPQLSFSGGNRYRVLILIWFTQSAWGFWCCHSLHCGLYSLHHCMTCYVGWNIVSSGLRREDRRCTGQASHSLGPPSCLSLLHSSFELPTSLWKGEGRCSRVGISKQVQALEIKPTSCKRRKGLGTGWFHVVESELRGESKSGGDEMSGEWTNINYDVQLKLHSPS